MQTASEAHFAPFLGLCPDNQEHWISWTRVFL